MLSAAPGVVLPMRHPHILIYMAATVTVLLCVWGCGDGATEPPALAPEPPRPTSVTVTPATAQLTALGATVQLAAQVSDQNGQPMAGATVTWTSSSAAVATVDGSGLVTAVGNGTTTITASAGAASGTGEISVAQLVDSVAVSPSADTIIALGDTLRLSAEAFDANGHQVQEAEFSWTSGDTLVATVDGSGLVTAVGSGTTTIIATAGAASGTGEISVMPPAVVSLVTSSESAPEGGTVALQLAAFPAPESSIAIGYSIGIDDDDRTADADVSDYLGDAHGTVDIAAGDTVGSIELTITDDDDIEPTREFFIVTLDPPAPGGGYVLGAPVSASVEIREGVCDRTPQIREEILRQTGTVDCAVPTDGVLSQIRELDFCFPAGLPKFCPLGDTPRFDVLTTVRKGDFSGLAGLRTLELRGNRLTDLPPGVFSGLPSMRSLSIVRNQLTELSDSAFSDLAGLVQLKLNDNRLRELSNHAFGGLSNLSELHLSGNELTTLPSGMFSVFSSDLFVDLFGNPGSPFSLTMSLARTDGKDAMAPGPAELEVRLAEGAPFDMTVLLSAQGGALSASRVSLSAGDVAGPGFTLTPNAASGSVVSVTVSEVPDVGTVCPHCRGISIGSGDPLVLANPAGVTVAVPAVYLTQGPQNLVGDVPLIAGRRAFLRVFAVADGPNAFVLGGRARFFVDGERIYEASLDPLDAGIPVRVDESRLGLSLNAIIPGHVLRPGLGMVVELDPDGTIPVTQTSGLRYPNTGRHVLDVRELPPLELTIVPVLYHSEANRGTNDAVLDFARELATTDSRGFVSLARSILPIGDLRIGLRDPYYTWADTASAGLFEVLSEVDMVRHLDRAQTHYYHGVFAVPAERDPKTRWSGGVALLGGKAAVSNYADSDRWWILFTHEFGHNLSLGHTPCGRAAGVDPDFPYGDGSIGVWGHSFVHLGATERGRLLHPLTADIMGYCNTVNAMLSDYNFTKALEHRLEMASLAARHEADSARKVLLLWGGIDQGTPRLEPAFAHEAPVKLPKAVGPYRLTGLDSAGRRLFSLSFAPDELDHGGSSFLFAIPFQPEWTQALDRISLSGPEGTTIRDRSTGGEAALAFDAVSGALRSVLRTQEGARVDALGVGDRMHIVRGLPRR